MNTNGFRVLIGAWAVGFLGLTAMAEDKPIPAAKQAELLKRHPELDTDKDGKLTRDEVRKSFTEKHAKDRKGLPKGESVDSRDPAKGKGLPMGRPDPAQFLAKHPEADTDKDGKLIPAEMREYMRSHGDVVRAELLKNHPELDANKDGVLSEDEIRAGRGKRDLHARMAEMVLKRFPESDTDKDGRINPEEMRTFMETRGDEVRAEVLKRRPELDTNKDGVLSREELQAARDEQGTSPSLKGRAPEMILKRFPEADKDKDGKLSDEELKAFREAHGDQFRAGILKRFPEADTNKDGRVSEEELKTLKEKKRADANIAPKGKAREGRPFKKGGVPR